MGGINMNDFTGVLGTVVLLVGIVVLWLYACPPSRYSEANSNIMATQVDDETGGAWVQRSFDDFAQGWFEDAGSNLYVNAHGIVEMIHRTDVNNDGYVDIILLNVHGNTERGPTWIYTQSEGEGKNWLR